MQSRVLSICALLAYALAVNGEEKSRPAEAIQDNSFLIEEAYNQEAGVVQHILTFQYEVDHRSGEDDRSWTIGFTQEWPFLGQRHQLSYTVPYSFVEGPGISENGVGDVFLHYRLQALFESATLPAFAPRVSLALPTGEASKGFGDNTLGYQLNLPVSKVVHHRWTVHGNTGFTVFPDLRDRNPLSYNVGASAIYAVSHDLNLMLEFVGEWIESVDENRSIERDFDAVLSPGLRYAFNRPTTQWVLGIAAPIGLTASAPDVGVFLYASFEHMFKRHD